MKLNCLIIDDEPIARKILAEFIADIEFLHLAAQAENPVKAIPLLDKNDIDLLFLDINMPRLNGIEFLKSAVSPPAVIITTAYPQYAAESFSLDVVDYLVKPIAFERFLKACNKAKQHIGLKGGPKKDSPDTDHFFVKSDKNIEKIFYDDLLYIEGLLNYVVLHTIHGKVVVYITIKSILEQLPSELFIKVHKSYIINAQKIKSIEGNMISVGSEMIPIGQSVREEVLEKILKGKLIKR